jgi:putative transposase
LRKIICGQLAAGVACRAASARVPDVPLQLIQRANNRQMLLRRRRSPDFISIGSASTRGLWEAEFTLGVDDQSSPLATVGEPVTIAGQVDGAVGHLYAQYTNRADRSSGTLWEGRYRSCLMHEEIDWFACQRSSK